MVSIMAWKRRWIITRKLICRVPDPVILKLKNAVGHFTLAKLYGQDDRLLTKEKLVSIAILPLNESIKDGVDRDQFKPLVDEINQLYLKETDEEREVAGVKK